MSEELKTPDGAAETQQPENKETPEVATPVEAVAPTSESAPEAAASAEPAPAQSEQPATAQCDSHGPFAAPCDPIAADTGLPAEPLKRKIEPENPEPKEEEDNTPLTEDEINTVLSVVKETGRFKGAFLSVKTGMKFNRIKKILAVLEERKIIGMRGATRVLLIDTAAKPTTAQPKAAAPAKKKMLTDADRMTAWQDELRDRGGFQDHEVCKFIAQYAIRNPGFNPARKNGHSLISMINRWAMRARDRLATFTEKDADILHNQMLRLISEQPFGEGGPQIWNMAGDNREQLEVARRFYGIGFRQKSLANFNKDDLLINCVLDAARPSQIEEEKGFGGTYSERLHYLVLAMIAFSTDERFFKAVVHLQPTESYTSRQNGGGNVGASWHDGEKCNECGSPITTDANGNVICSMITCFNHYPKTGGSFTPGNPSNGGAAHPARRSWKDNAPRGDREDQRGFSRKKGNGKQRWRNREGGDSEADGGFSGGTGTTVTSGEDVPNTPFANL